MKQRFLTITASYITDGCYLIISDNSWYVKHEEEIEIWAEQCLTNGLVREGTLLKFVNDMEQNIFLMRWSNG
jgi:hypothetical protein